LQSGFRDALDFSALPDLFPDENPRQLRDLHIEVKTVKKE